MYYIQPGVTNHSSYNRISIPTMISSPAVVGVLARTEDQIGDECTSKSPTTVNKPSFFNSFMPWLVFSPPA
jgi:hypothetical protein